MKESEFDEKLENNREASKTYHIRFQRLCTELNKSTNDWLTVIPKYEGLIDQGFADETVPIMIKYGELYSEFGECLELIGENQVEFTDLMKGGLSKLEEKIAETD